MNKAIAWFAENRVAANLLMIFIIVAGLLTIFSITLEVFPDINPAIITVTVAYPGAAPEEVEEGVCVKIEEAVYDLQGVKKLTSTSSEGMGAVSVQATAGYDIQKLLDDVKTRVDAINTFPQEAEKPVIQELLRRLQVINVAVSGQTDELTLKRIGERVRDDISDLDDVSQVDLAGSRPYEISLEVSEETLRNYGLTFDEVARAVRLSSLNLPGGSIRAQGGEISLRTKGQAYRGAEFENIILRSFPDGTRLHLGDVAHVKDAFAETDELTRFDGAPAVLVKVYRVGKENALTVSHAVKQYIAEKQPTLPEGIYLTSWQDDAVTLKDRLSLLLSNARIGLVLVFILLALFLRLRLAWWVSMGMVVAFLGALWVLPFFEVSINQLSLFSFIMVLGIVVDDAIVIGENVFTHIKQGKPPLQAAIEGTQQVAVPVVFAVLTTVAAFLPLAGVPGVMGDVMRIVPIVVIATLIFSLVEALFVLPAHLSHVNYEKADHPRWAFQRFFHRMQENFSNSLEHFVHVYYKKTLEWSLKWRYTVIALSLASLIITIAVAAGGALKFTFMPSVEADNVVAMLSMPGGTPSGETAKALKRLENSANTLKQDYNTDGQLVIEHMLTSIGDQPFRKMSHSSTGGQNYQNKANLGEVNIQLTPSDQRPVTSEALAARWRKLTGAIPDAEELIFSSSMFSVGDPINIQLAGTDYEELRRAAGELRQKLAGYAGVFDIADSYRSGKKEIELKINPEAEALGLTLSDLARQVRQAFYGEEVQRIQRGRDELRVMVRYPVNERRSIGDLENMRVRLPDGSEIPFSVAARVDQGFGFSSIDRTDRKRTISVTANLDKSVGNSNEILADVEMKVMPGLMIKYPSVAYSLAGEQEEQAESLSGIRQGFLIALLMIYVLLAIPFRSYVQPFIVMSAIPFGIVGALWGHILLGVDLSMMSMFGIVALSGVVVNDSLVMVDFINRDRRSGTPLIQAIRDAGIVRFRPILLTTVTTFAGLLPLILEKSPQAQFLIPMAISLAFGVMFGTFITLILVPVIYYSQEDLKAVFAKLRRGSERKHQELVEA